MTDPRTLNEFRAEPILGQLYGFQRDAVEHAFHRLFVAQDCTRRFLLADEVGLGKTLIAKGIIARAIEHLRERGDRIDILYICSNQSIARQNIARLNPLPEREVPNAERITLLPLYWHAMSSSPINILALTPGTSLDIKDSLGTRRERILLYLLLEELWGLKGAGPQNLLQGEVRSSDGFRESIRSCRSQYRDIFSRSEALLQSFRERLNLVPELRGRFGDLCSRFAYSRIHIPAEERRDRNDLVGQLRTLLAQTCIAALEPDLVILDEFQRFRHLLDDTPTSDEAAQLARQLFEWSSQDKNAHAHVLLMSATPYKPYTLQHEANEDDHYRDFISTVSFLKKSSFGADVLRSLFRDFRRELLRGAPDSPERLRRIKDAIQLDLRQVMSRTERLAVAGEHNGMLRSVLGPDLAVTGDDITGYVCTRRLSDAIEVDDPIEYWKSAAYALNFMEGYRLKTKLKEALESGVMTDDVGRALREAAHGLLTADLVKADSALPMPNAKVRALIAGLDKADAFNLLWLPPSLPAYQLGRSFARARAAGFTKRLIFSAWNVVPRSIAALVSFEAEYRAQAGDVPGKRAEKSAGKEQSGLLRISMDDGRPSGMPVLMLMYPSVALARIGDLRTYAKEHGDTDASFESVYQWAKQRVRDALPRDIAFASRGEAADDGWYWSTPLILDSKENVEETTSWWGQERLDDIWTAEQPEEEAVRAEEEGELQSAAWTRHVALARDVALGKVRPKGLAPNDLVDILALVAIAGPGVCAARAMANLFPGALDGRVIRNAAAQIGWSFRRLLNRPQSMPIVRAGARDEPYWLLALRYCAEGCLASVLDEYVHVLRDETGMSAKQAPEACAVLSDSMNESLGLRAATLTLDEIQIEANATQPTLRDLRMRTLFAMRFGSDKSEDAKQVVRDRSVRAAFNSPFWPFVLASTSVGQEGLDFHWYCHAIVHWNLPTNPVDLEQREGRVHRFKGHAVRKNVAAIWGSAALLSDTPDPWSAAFHFASGSVQGGGDHKGLIPYWLYPIDGGAWIERHVLLYPLSRDVGRFQRLREALGVYRLVFGQPRQDELLAYLRHRVDAKPLAEMERYLRIDLSPKASDAGR